MGFEAGFSRSDKGDRWCPVHQASIPCSKCKEDQENAAAKKLVEKSLAAAEPKKPAAQEKRVSIEASMDLIGKKVDLLEPEDLKSFISLFAESEGVLPKHLRALGDAYRSLPERKQLPPSVAAMMKQMGKSLPTSQSENERVRMAITKLSPEERVEVSKSMDLYLSRSQKRGKRTG